MIPTASQTATRLDADELLHLAMEAARHDRHDAALEFLKRAIELDPGHAKARYFLAAEYAQIGLYDRAVEEMEKSVKLDPSLHTANFQLGLLHLTSGRVAQASAAWLPLDALGESDPLFLFKKGLEAMANDRFAECREYLNKGMERNQINPDLNNDMQRVLDQLPADPQQEAKTANAGDNSSHVFLSAYRSDSQPE
jgi:tetratricopeptide (TPR) repeat protein